jgi:alkylation response protein AidB-like acyl-CoA dehydrogenase
MNFAFTEEQEELRKTVRAFLDAKSSETAVREQMETENGFDPAVWSQMGEQMGLQGLVIPEEFGGSGFSFVELGVVLEEMGRALLCAPYFSTVVLAAQALIHSGDAAAKKKYLPGIAAGETIATLATTEPSGKWDESGITMQAKGSGSSFTLSGTKTFVLDGHTASLIIVAARTGKGVSLFAVDGKAKGLTRTALSTMDQTRKQAKLEFADVPAELIGKVRVGTCSRACSTSPPSHSPPSRLAVHRRCSRWQSSTPRCACSSVVQLVHSRRSSTSAPTCCSKSSRPSRLRTTACGVQAR